MSTDHDMRQNTPKVSHATLPGRLLRSHREDSTHGGGQLSQDALLNFISVHNPSAPIYDRSVLSHRELGRRTCPRQFLIDFGRALELDVKETDGLLVLAGYESITDAAQQGEGVPTTAPSESIAAALERIREDVRVLATAPSVLEGIRQEIHVTATALVEGGCCRPT